MNTDKQQWHKFFERYNQVYGEAFERLINDENAFTDIQPDNNGQALRIAVGNIVRNWHENPLDDQPGSPSGSDLLRRIGTLGEAADLARLAAFACDDDLPEIIKLKLAAFGQPMVDRLLSDLMQADFARADETADDELFQEKLVSAGFLRLLGDWRRADCLAAVVNKFSDAGEPDDLLADAIRYFLSAVGSPSLPFLIAGIEQKLSDLDDLDTAGEYMLIALTDIAKSGRSDAAFNSLRSAFRKMSRKAIGASCLGDYGDGRGITVLKGWLDRNPDFTDNQVISEILSAIKRLGGDISDVQNRLRLQR